MIRCIVLLALATSVAVAQPPPATLHIGDAAPSFGSGEFLKGEAITKFEKGKAYVIHFWGTPIGPYGAGLRHISKLQAHYKNITFVSQDCLEDDAKVVKPFLAKLGDGVNVRVALDDTSQGGFGKMASAWLVAAGETDLPRAFLVDGEGKIAWIGHPMQLDRVLRDFAAGKLDMKSEAAARDAAQKLDRDVAPLLEGRDWDELLRTLDASARNAPPALVPIIEHYRFTALVQRGQFPEAMTVAKTLADSAKDHPVVLNEVAWALANPDQPFPHSDLELAMKCAQRAVELSEADPNFVDTLATVYAARGNVDKAIELETQAIAEMDDDGMKEQFRATLERFKAKKGQ